MADTKKGGAEESVVATVRKMVEEGFGGVWKSLIACPAGTKFEAQHEEEQVLLLMRRHPITNWKWIVLLVILVGVPLFWEEFPLVTDLTGLTRLALTVFWYMSLAFFAIQNVLLWFYNVYIITDERIIDVDFFGLLHKNVNVMQIRKVEDVNYSQMGIMASTFNYGNVIIETASEQQTEDRFAETSAFTFEAVSNPDKVVKVINELIEQEEREEYEGRTR